MRVLIVEDETSSYENLLSILKEVALDIEVVLNTDTPERLFVSKNRAAEFKHWMTS